MNLSIINNLLRDWGTDPAFIIGMAGLPLVFLALRKGSGRPLLRSFRILLAVGWVAIISLFSAPVIVNPLVDKLEQQYALDDSCLATSPIVILGAGLDRRAKRPEQTEYLYPSSHIRSSRGAALADEFQQAPVVVAGLGLSQVTEADMMRAYLTQRGIEPNRIAMDVTSKNTWENAVNVAEIVKTKNWGEQVRLVTSAIHMPRAMGVFEANGLKPCAIPVDFIAVQNVVWYAVVPQTTALAKFRTFLHEKIGTSIYRIKGWL